MRGDITSTLLRDERTLRILGDGASSQPTSPTVGAAEGWTEEGWTEEGWNAVLDGGLGSAALEDDAELQLGPQPPLMPAPDHATGSAAADALASGPPPCLRRPKGSQPFQHRFDVAADADALKLEPSAALRLPSTGAGGTELSSGLSLQPLRHEEAQSGPSRLASLFHWRPVATINQPSAASVGPMSAARKRSGAGRAERSAGQSLTETDDDMELEETICESETDELEDLVALEPSAGTQMTSDSSDDSDDDEFPIIRLS